eukprot:TRINITY_DN2220_c0_g1_i21.p1 TRINITY_DN2220_c0_g1~~TRINITY_DN2220_c0_g1_i21.p1  ORF type:complete len:137 (-),score=19.20 TRINITY_DN2220_c0_g1_i21:45-455(-)
MALQVSDAGLRAMKRKDYRGAIRFFTEALAVEEDRTSCCCIAGSRTRSCTTATGRGSSRSRRTLPVLCVAVPRQSSSEAEVLRVDSSSPLPYALIALARFHQGEYLRSARKATHALRCCAEDAAVSPSAAASEGQR